MVKFFDEMKKVYSIAFGVFYVFCALASLTSCDPIHHLDPYFEKVELKENIAQEGSVVWIPMEYRQVDTKFQPGMSYRPFRFRAMVDDVQYSYGICNHKHIDNQYLRVVVPANDSYQEREVAIEVSYSDGYDIDKGKWEDWIRIFDGRQDGLEEGAPLLEPLLEDMTIYITIGPVCIPVQAEEGSSVMSLKWVLYHTSLGFNINVYDDFITTGSSENNNILRNSVPVNHVTFCENGALYMHDEGRLFLTRNFSIDNVTLIGRIAESDMDALRTVFAGPEEQMMSLSLQ